MIKLEYGKSMYGGWYAQSFNPVIVIRTNTLKELKKKVNDLGMNCKLSKRFDN